MSWKEVMCWPASPEGATEGRAAPVGAKREGASVPQRAALLLSPLRQPQCRGKGRYCIGASEGTRLVAADAGALTNVGNIWKVLGRIPGLILVARAEQGANQVC